MARPFTARTIGRAGIVFLALALALGGPFLIWGEDFASVTATGSPSAWLSSYGDYAWAAAITLLIADLALPVPTTAVMAALGIIYGPLLGGAIASFASVLSGIIGYGLGSQLGRPLVLRLFGPEILADVDPLFARGGGWAVALSRWLPIVSEVVACMAGLSRMPLNVFVAALLCGSVPLGFAFAAIGKAGEASPLWTLALSAVAPFALWMIVRPLLNRSVR